MSHRKKNPSRSRILLFSLALYLSVGIGSDQGLSLVSMMMNGSHQTFLAGENAQIRLVFHHPGHQDEHETSPEHLFNGKAGQFDKVSTAGTGNTPDPDHEFYLYLSEHDQQITTTATTKTIENFKTLLSFPTTEQKPFLVPPVSARPSPPPLFKISTTLLSLHATVLLI